MQNILIEIQNLGIHLCDLAELSLTCERVFALLRRLFGEQQMSALSDYLQTSLMLNFHDRSVG